jgi:hypothetical protein
VIDNLQRLVSRDQWEIPQVPVDFASVITGVQFFIEVLDECSCRHPAVIAVDFSPAA